MATPIPRGFSLLILLLPLASSLCASEFDCQLNGACVSSSCACRPGWTGADCGALDLLPAPAVPAFYRATTASWGGSIIEEQGLHYMFLAVIEGHCGLNAWQPNSAIYRAVSASGPAGPYVNETRIPGYFSHNPSVSRHPDGSLLVWHIGDGRGGGGFNTACTNGTTPPPPPPPPIKMKTAGGCLVASGAYPCWTGGNGPYKACPLVVGDCSAPSAQWGVEGTSWVSAVYPGASINM